MSKPLAQYLFQMTPILIGAIFVLLIREVRLPEAAIKIRHTSALVKGEKSKDEKSNWNRYGFIINLPVHFSEIHTNSILSDLFAAYHFTPSHEDKLSLWRGYMGEFEDMHAGVFKRISYDMLILNGFLNGKTELNDIHGVVFDKLGVIDIRKAQKLNSYLRKHKKEKIRVFAPDKSVLLRYLLSFNGGSGILLSYLIVYNLNVLGAEYGYRD